MLGLCIAVLSCVLTDFSSIRSASFLLHVVLTVLVGLVAFEITGLYGNRSGAMPAIWSAFLLSCYPCGAGNHMAPRDLFAFFILLSFFFYQRFRRLKEKPYVVAAVISFVLSAVTGGLPALILPLMLFPYELIFKNSPLFLQCFEKQQEPNIINPVLSGIHLMFFGTIWLSLSLLSQLGTAMLDKGARYSSIAMPIVIFCIFLPLITLPLSGASNQKQARHISITGMMIITVIAWSFHNLHSGQGLF
jgi:hypothetical protein